MVKPVPSSYLQTTLKAVRKKIHLAISEDDTLMSLLLRATWHSCGTFDKKLRNGGSNGGTFRFEAERNDPENNGFANAFVLYEKIKQEHPELSYADLFVLCGYVALEWCGGPKIPFSFGRQDFEFEHSLTVYGNSHGCPFGDGKHNPNTSRLPTADGGCSIIGNSNYQVGSVPVDDCEARQELEKKTIDSMRNTFTRMGFNDKETVCLIILGHQFGRCHLDVSGYQHFWYPFAPYDWNVYNHGFGYLAVYNMVSRFQEVITPNGKRQFETNFSGENFMLLVSDMCLYWDKEYRKHLDFYQSNRVSFRKDAAAVWKKLTELGCEGLLTPEQEE